MRNEIFDKFELLKKSADQALYFDRNDKDSYVFDFVTLKNDLKRRLSKSEVSFLLPTGSKWNRLIGWRSIFCIPLTKSGFKYFALGVEKIVRHSSRGAYPISHIFFFQDIANLYKAMCILNDDIFIKKTPNDLRCDYNGIIKVNSPDLKSFEKREKWILKCAEKKYSINDPILFRTAILMDNHLDQIKSFDFPTLSLLGNSEKISIDRDKFLVGIPKKIEKTLSSYSKLKLMLINQIPAS